MEKVTINRPAEHTPKNRVDDMKFGDWGVGRKIIVNAGEKALFFRSKSEVVAFPLENGEGRLDSTYVSIHSAPDYYFVEEILSAKSAESITIRL